LGGGANEAGNTSLQWQRFSFAMVREYYLGSLANLFTFPALGGLLFGYDIVDILFP
jgi:hypothetical protein